MPHAVLSPAGRSPSPAGRSRRRRRILTRAAPAALAFVVIAVVVMISAGAGGRAERAMVRDYLTAWSRGHYRAMYHLLDESSHRRITYARFGAALAQAASTATMTSLRAGRIGRRAQDLYPVEMTIGTRLFGPLRAVLEVPVSGEGDSARVRYSDRLLFPGVGPGEHLSRITTLPQRAAILARDGAPLAAGAARSSPIPDVAGQIVGSLGPIPPERAAEYAAAGYPPEAKVGQNGLELIFERRLAGTPGGTLRSGHRVLASSPALASLPVASTIDPALERAAASALAGRYGGIVVMNPRNGELLAVAGVAFSALQPPGSTFKIITLTGVLEAGIAKPSSTFPVETQTLISGVPLQNANGESCGGTLVQAFANSCNSVFAPLGAKLGAAKLVDVAQRFGFNQPWPFAEAATSVIPAASKIGDALSVGSSAIGQGMVQSTTLGMTDVAATIAMGGRRPIPTLTKGEPPRFVRVTSPAVARTVQRMMLAVVRYGTGTSAQIPGVRVAGKTGTAELRSTVPQPGDQSASQTPVDTTKNTDSWFVGYAPAGHPRFVVGALFPEAGAGATTAAPAVHDVLAAALRK